MSSGRAGGGRAPADLVDWRLYLVTDPHLAASRDAVPQVAHDAVLGGVGVVQVRDKEVSDDEFATRAAAVVEAVGRAAERVGGGGPGVRQRPSRGSARTRAASARGTG